PPIAGWREVRCYQRPMGGIRTSVRAFRGLRFVPSRVELASIVGGASAGAGAGDPRHVRKLLDDSRANDDAKDAPVRRAKLRLAEWQRAGVMKRDDQAAVYAVRRRTEKDGEAIEAIGFFAAVSVDAVTAVPSGTHEARFDIGVAV